MTDPTVLIVSQPNTATHNQLVYVRLGELGWNVKQIVPARWTDDYSPGGYKPVAVDGFVGTFARVPVAVRGEVQRHFYVTRPTRWLDRWKPAAMFAEQEPFSFSGLQWGRACERRGIPWGLQGDENLDRPFPRPAYPVRRWCLEHADFFAARSVNAGEMLRFWGARGEIGVVAHTIPEWELGDPPSHDGKPFTIGFAGRLVELKGIRDLLAACGRLGFPYRLLVVGDGPLRELVEAHAHAEVRTGLRTDDMIAAYQEMDVLVLPSRTQETWAEQFGKVLCEALLCGVPVVGSSCGEIPWVIETARGGLVFPEGDADALAARLTELHDDPGRRRALATAGRAGVKEHFAPRVAARELDRMLRTAIERRSA